MKFLIIMILGGLVAVSPAIAEQQQQTTKQKENGGKVQKKRKDKRLPGPWNILKNISDEERGRLRVLYDTDPKTFREELAKIVKRIKLEKQKQDDKVKALVDQYKNSKNPEKKQAALKELREITTKIFYSKMEHNKKRLESLEKQVKSLRSQYEFRQKNADKIIQARLDVLTGSTNFEWDN